MTDAIAAQLRAARPDASSWVAANAGSGKTRVLTDRVARLLLAGTDPQRILCLTYTKAAAAEMQNRLFRTLGAWAMLGDPELRHELRTLGEPGDAIPPARLDRARTLFARALETPGGLRIQTIHAFCESLLRRFPLEASVAPQFAVLDDRAARALREQVLDDLVTAERAAFAAVVPHLGGADPDLLLLEIARHREAFAAPFDPSALARALGAEPDLTPERLLAEAVGPDDEALIAELLPLLAASGPSDRGAADTLAAALAAADAETRLARLEEALLTKSGATPFAARTGRFPTKGLRQAHPGLCARLDALMARVEAARPRRVALAAYDRAAALNVFGRAWLTAYGRAKAGRGLLDFDDMIDRANALLGRPDTAAWVLWRLDGGLDHILVDEAQDTSPGQWRVIGALTDEFFAGRGARDVTRTIFVVGDEKQSIYSFQGADPDEFAAKRRRFSETLDAIGDALQHCDLLHSFRSSPPILRLVDSVFAGTAGEGIEQAVAHHAHDPDRPGRVELWPFLPKPEKPDDTEWDDPREAPAPGDPVERLATAIAERVRSWLEAGRLLPGGDAPIRASDVMVLVQRRGPIFHAVIRALKRAGVPVAGADVLRIGAELAVNDLVAALRVAATPSDDLSLAAVLRSPLGGLSERRLFELAHGRAGTLWRALDAAPPGLAAEARALLADLRDQADYLRPFELLTRILVRHDGRRRLVARLGPEAEDGIDALLDQALAYEGVEPPTLTGFLAWFDRDPVTVKRRSEAGADQVRVMTVHGAKGLEAPIVILPDTAVTQDGWNPPSVVRLDEGWPAWRRARDLCPPALAAAEARRRRTVRLESRRLLYVALTRARQWLIVAGAGVPANGNGGGSGESWHDLVSAAMNELDAGTEPGPLGDTRVLSHGWRDGFAGAAGVPAAGPPPPCWLHARTPRPAATPRLLSPSLLGGALTLVGEALGERPEDAQARGTALHALLEHLHGRPPAEHAALAARLLPGHRDLDALLDEAARVLSAPALAGVFAPEGLAEVAIAAPVPGRDDLAIAGRIDRLVPGERAVLAVDFKSNRVVPAAAEDVPEGILRQLGAYRAALAPVWPDRPVEVAVLWTRAARLMPVPAALADAAFARGLLDLEGGRS
jgi:ATP-dependent helicase/nuclease subunit A